MPPETTPDILLTHYEWTVARLGEALRNEPSEYFRDAALQRFGFTCEMAFKCLSAFADPAGDAPTNPEESLRWAAKEGFFGTASEWEGIASAYQEINCKPGRDRADAIFARLENYLTCFRDLLTNLRAKRDGA